MNLTFEILRLEQGMTVDFNAGKTQLPSIDWSNNSGSIDAKMDALEAKSHFSFFSKLDWASYTVSIAKTTSKALLRSMKFLSPEVALYFYKSTIPPCMK